MSNHPWKKNISYDIPLESLKSQDYGQGDNMNVILDKSGK